MTNYKALKHWHLAEELSVCDAAVLICGRDPSTAFSKDPYLELDPWEDVDVEGFCGIFKALVAAIRRQKIAARLAFKAYSGPERREANFRVVYIERGRIETNLDNDPLFMLADGDTWEAEWADKLVIEKDPSWDKSMVDVEDLKRWLSSRGYTDNFFFANDADKASTANIFLDRNHPHFSPELALAVRAWDDLKGEKELRRSPKQAIRHWIDSHPEAWEGDAPLSNEAKERISIMVNWKKEGGANRTS